MLHGLVSDTQDGVRQIARALEEAVTTSRNGAAAPIPAIAPATHHVAS